MSENLSSRRERERLMHRREILDAAERVFVRNGFGAATVEQVAREADFAVGTIYNFFESKRKLFEEVMTRMASDAFALLEERVFSEPDPMKALKALIEVRLVYAHEHSDLCQVFLEVQPSIETDLPHPFPADCQELYERYLASVTKIIKDGTAREVFRAVDPLYLTLCLEGAFRVINTHWIRKGSTEPLAERVAGVTKILLGMVCSPGTGNPEELTE